MNMGVEPTAHPSPQLGSARHQIQRCTNDSRRPYHLLCSLLLQPRPTRQRIPQ